jgi:hypothetical protein
MAKAVQMGLASALLIATFGLVPDRSQAATSLCDGIAGNLVSNCGFEGGVYSSTIGGNTNPNVPNSWTANAAFDLEPGFNNVNSSDPNSGTYKLQIGNDDFQSTPSVSQTLTDVSSTTYNGAIWINYDEDTDPGAIFQVLVNGTAVLTLNGPGPYGNGLTYAEYLFSFVGTGSDALTIQALTDPGEWSVDDVSVTAAPVSATPLPAALPLFATGLGAMGLFGWRRKRKGAAFIAVA